MTLRLQKKLQKSKQKQVRTAKAPRSAEVKYRNTLYALVERLKRDTNTIVVPLLKQLEADYVNDAYAKTLSEAFDRLRNGYINIDKNARVISESFTQDVDNHQKQRFYVAMEEAVGVNLQSVIQRDNVEDVLVSMTRSNVALIRSIPEEYFKKIESMIWTNVTQGTKSTSMIKELQKIGNVTEKRARLIARDQTAKLNSALNQQRQQNLGIEEYVWRTSGDGDRVRETHRENNGKTFRWDDPPETGHPGEDIQCRCVAIPIIKL